MRRFLVKDPSGDGFAAFHEHVRTHPPHRLYDLTRLVLAPCIRLLYRPRCVGAKSVPARGPAIIAANHFSYLDPLLVAYCLERRLRFMAMSQLFEGPLRVLMPYLGAFPVRRGAEGEETFKTAHAVLRDDDVVGIYPEGGRSPPGRLRDPKPGVGRLALESGAPVIPTAIAGSEEVRHWRRLHFPAITIRYGEPIVFDPVEDPSREQAQAAAERIFDEVKRLFGEESRRRQAAAA